jgi:hypothetical protein
MKNIQVIDGAVNCTFSFYQVTDDEFIAVFPGSGQDIEFIEDVAKRLPRAKIDRIFKAIWDRPIKKTDVVGVHGTLFYEFEKKRKWFPTSKRERDWNPSALSRQQRRMYEDSKE